MVRFLFLRSADCSYSQLWLLELVSDMSLHNLGPLGELVTKKIYVCRAQGIAMEFQLYNRLPLFVRSLI